MFKITPDFEKNYRHKNVEIRCSDGEVIRGLVLGVEQEYPRDLGVDLKNVEINGEKVSYHMVIPSSQIESFAVI
jgi:hypothetical protein